jgi:hypothetical protein
MPADPSAQEPAAELLEHLLGSLLSDFRFWFERGELLLALCPDNVMAVAERETLAAELAQARRELIAATSLCQATRAPVALAMDTLAPWHQLVMRVWTLSASLRRSGVSLPELSWPEPPAFSGL